MLAFGDHHQSQSSNSFATGAHQNCNNVLTEKPTTRVAAPPGGQSSFSLGWSTERAGAATPGRRCSSNAFASGVRQNCQNVLSDIRTTRVAAPPGGRSSISLAWEDTPQRSTSTPAVGNHARARRQLSCFDKAEHEDAAQREECLEVMVWDKQSQCWVTKAHAHYGRDAYSKQFNEDATTYGEVEQDCSGAPATQCDIQGREIVLMESSPQASVSDVAEPNDMWAVGQQRRSCDSSNAFARGTDQNCNNVLTDRPSTRVHAPPGGRCSLSLAWDVSEPYAQQDRTGSCPAEQQRGFGRRASCTSANAFANGMRQNCQNVLTDTPSTRVAAPPGGRSSFSLAWNNAPRGSKGDTTDADSIQQDCSFGGSCAGLSNLKSRMCRRQSNQHLSEASVSQVYNNRCGYGDSSVSVSDVTQRSVSAPRLRPKDEVDGSKPRKWKPAKTPMRPSGSHPSLRASEAEEAEQKVGRKRFPDVGAGSNRDVHAIEALRFFQTEERVGKLPVEMSRPAATNRDRESHRFYLAAEGKLESTPGKARRPSSTADRHGKVGPNAGCCNELLGSESTSAGSGDDGHVHSECDSLPLGAEWSSF